MLELLRTCFWAGAILVARVLHNISQRQLLDLDDPQYIVIQIVIYL